MQKRINVHIGKIEVAKNGELLKAILGSCVGIGVIWKNKSLCALAHCLLPRSHSEITTIGAQFVDQAFYSIFTLLKIEKQNLEEIDFIIVGGGNMTYPSKADDNCNGSELIGTLNFKQAIEQAKTRKLRVVYKEGEGDFGRKLIIDCSNYSYKIEKIPRIFQG